MAVAALCGMSEPARAPPAHGAHTSPSSDPISREWIRIVLPHGMSTEEAGTSTIFVGRLQFFGLDVKGLRRLLAVVRWGDGPSGPRTAGAASTGWPSFLARGIAASEPAPGERSRVLAAARVSYAHSRRYPDIVPDRISTGDADARRRQTRLPRLAQCHPFSGRRYCGSRTTARWPEKWLAVYTWLRIRARGQRGGLFFVDRRALEKLSGRVRDTGEAPIAPIFGAGIDHASPSVNRRVRPAERVTSAPDRLM
jgi:hypothetical protein